MELNKKSFVLYFDQKAVFEALTTRECKELILAIFNFTEGIETRLTSKTQIAFISIRNQLSRDLKKWEANSEMRKEFGRLGGLAKAGKNYLKPDLLSKPAVNVDVNVIKKEPSFSSGVDTGKEIDVFALVDEASKLPSNRRLK